MRPNRRRVHQDDSRWCHHWSKDCEQHGEGGDVRDDQGAPRRGRREPRCSRRNFVEFDDADLERLDHRTFRHRETQELWTIPPGLVSLARCRGTQHHLFGRALLGRGTFFAASGAPRLSRHMLGSHWLRRVAVSNRTADRAANGCREVQDHWRQRLSSLSCIASSPGRLEQSWTGQDAAWRHLNHGARRRSPTDASGRTAALLDACFSRLRCRCS
jgi:hypothetical protein